MRTKNFVWYWNIVHYFVYRFLVNQSFSRPTMHAGGFMGILLINIDWSIFNFCQYFFQFSLSDWIYKNGTNQILFLCILLAPAFFFNYFFLFKDDEYLEYFSEFDNMKSDEKNRYMWVSIITVLLIWIFFIFSFKYIK